MRAVRLSVCCAVFAVLVIGAAAVPAAAAAATGSSGSSGSNGLSCPPDCGFVAAGDPLLVPYMTVDPGAGWLAVPASDVEPYVTALAHNLGRGGDGRTLSNVAAARWSWATGRYQLQIVLVSSPQLAKLGFADPEHDIAFLCAAAHGSPRGSISTIRDVPGSVSALCQYPPKAGADESATVAAFRRGDVAALLQVTSTTKHPINFRGVEIAALEQYASLSPSGVVVSRGGDPALLGVWGCLLVVVGVAAFLCARRRATWRGPIDAVTEALRRRWVPLAVSVAGVVGAMAFAMLDSPLLHGSNQWFVSTYGDLWRNWADGAYLTHGGGLGHLYHLDTTLETAPAWQVLTAPVARLSFGLSFPYPNPVLHPQAFWVAGPLFLLPMAFPLCAADRCLEVMGVHALGRRLPVLAVMAITLPPVALDGHPEDLIALGAMLYGLLAAVEGRERAVGWWLGAALAFQFYAFFAIPAALVLLARRQWGGALWRMAVVPLAVLAVPVAVDPSGTLHQLIHQRVYDASGQITPTWHLDPGVAAFLRAAVALVAIPLALLVARRRTFERRHLVNMVVFVLAVPFVLRVVEPELVPYFLGPALALLPLSAVTRKTWRFVASCGLSVWITWWLHTPVDARWDRWLVLMAQLAVACWLAWPAPAVAPAPEPEPEPVATPAAKAVRKPVRKPAAAGRAR